MQMRYSVDQILISILYIILSNSLYICIHTFLYNRLVARVIQLTVAQMFCRQITVVTVTVFFNHWL